MFLWHQSSELMVGVGNFSLRESRTKRAWKQFHIKYSQYTQYTDTKYHSTQLQASCKTPFRGEKWKYPRNKYECCGLYTTPVLSLCSNGSKENTNPNFFKNYPVECYLDCLQCDMNNWLILVAICKSNWEETKGTISTRILNKELKKTKNVWYLP